MSVYLNYDIGHCETTATTMTVKDGKNIVERLRLSGNHEDVIPSALSLTYDQIRKLGTAQITESLLQSLGEIRIGNDAITQPKDGEYFVYFKNSPENFNKPCGKSEAAKNANLTYGKLMAVFIYQVIRNTLLFNPDHKMLAQAAKDDISLLIGCPATRKWTDNKNVQMYADMISAATAIRRVSIVPESRASIFSAIGTDNKAISASRGVMVFDFGSSTADCTFMLLGRQIKEYSWDLGASQIEQQLLMHAFASARRRDPTVSVAENRDAMLRTLRQAKEAYYRNGEESDVICRFSSGSAKPVKESLTIDADMMEQVTNSDPISISTDSVSFKTATWQGLCREFMVKGRDYLEAHDLPCQTIVLTGGASHMDFIVELCREVFGSDKKILRDKNPSYCVATGLSWVAIADERHDECIQDAIKLLKENGSCNYLSLEKAIQDAVYSYACELVNQEASIWAKLPGDTLSVRDLEKRIKDKFTKPEAEMSIKRIIVKAFSTWLVNYKAGASAAVNSQSGKLFSEKVASELLLSEAIWKRLDASSVDINLDPTAILEALDIASVSNKILQEVVYYTVSIAVALALQAFPVINWIVGLLAGILAQAFVKDADMDKPRKQKRRKDIVEQMPKVLKDDKVVSTFRTSVKDAMDGVRTGYDSMVTDTVTTAIDMVMLRRFGAAE